MTFNSIKSVEEFLHTELLEARNPMGSSEWHTLKKVSETLYKEIYNRALEKAAKICNEAEDFNNELSQTRRDEKKHPRGCAEEILRWRIW